MKIGFIQSDAHTGRGIGFYVQHLTDALKDLEGVQVRYLESPDEMETVDIVHYPVFDFFKRTLKLSKKVASVVTVHDVTPLVFPEHFPPGLKGQINLHFQKKALQRVNAIITDSDYSKKDIKKYLQVPSSKLHVTHLAPSQIYKRNPESSKKLLVKYKLPDKFLLFVGNVNWNKNILNITQAAVNANIPIVLVGKSFGSKENLNHPEMRSYKQFLNVFSNHTLVKTLGYASDDELVALYNSARMLVFPTTYEGFGLPVLEAQMCECPVITSTSSSLPEVAGNGALLVNPNSIEEISAAILKLDKNDTLRDRLITKGLENAHQFTWQKTAEQTLAVYHQVIRSL